MSSIGLFSIDNLTRLHALMTGNFFIWFDWRFNSTKLVKSTECENVTSLFPLKSMFFTRGEEISIF